LEKPLSQNQCSTHGSTLVAVARATLKRGIRKPESGTGNQNPESGNLGNKNDDRTNSLQQCLIKNIAKIILQLFICFALLQPQIVIVKKFFTSFEQPLAIQLARLFKSRIKLSTG